MSKTALLALLSLPLAQWQLRQPVARKTLSPGADRPARTGPGLRGAKPAAARPALGPELVAIEQELMRHLGLGGRAPEVRPNLALELATQAGTAMASAAVGAAVEAVQQARPATLARGAAFGLGTWVLVHGVIGPMTGVTARKPLRQSPSTLAGQAAAYSGLGIAVAIAVEHLRRRPE